MPKFSQKSLKKLNTVHPDLQRLFMKVIKRFDCTITSGLRTAQEQNELYKKGRAVVDGHMQIVDKSAVVTYADGYQKKSNHQGGNAVDVVPYPSLWSDETELIRLGGYVKSVAIELGIDIEWGGDWKWKDYPHYQLVV
jgi:peptidoglycan L-alanyl-D-glutamate endopeptidase CwlK